MSRWGCECKVHRGWDQKKINSTLYWSLLIMKTPTAVSAVTAHLQLRMWLYCSETPTRSPSHTQEVTGLSLSNTENTSINSLLILIDLFFLNHRVLLLHGDNRARAHLPVGHPPLPETVSKSRPRFPFANWPVKPVLLMQCWFTRDWTLLFSLFFFLQGWQSTVHDCQHMLNANKYRSWAASWGQTSRAEWDSHHYENLVYSHAGGCAALHPITLTNDSMTSDRHRH